MASALASRPDGSTLAGAVTCGCAAGAPDCPQEWPRRRVMRVLIIAGELVGAERPAAEVAPGGAGRGILSSCPTRCQGAYHRVSLDAAPKAVDNVGVAIPDQVAVRLDWSAAEACPAQHVNQVLVQVGPPSQSGVPDGIYMAVGSISPPVIPADPERRAARVAELTASVVKVAVYGRVTMSREVLDDLIRVLQLTADQYDAAVALARRPRAPEQG